MKIPPPTRPATEPPRHEFLVLCARPEFSAEPACAPHGQPPQPPRQVLADFDGMFWRPPHLDNDAA